MPQFRITYFKPRFRWISFWKVRVDIYGETTLEEIQKLCKELNGLGVEQLSWFWWNKKDISYRELIMTENKDEVFEVYLRNRDGDTEHLPLREGLKKFLDPEQGYRLSINIEGVVITLRTSFDMDELRYLDEHLEQKTVPVAATIRGL